MHTYIAIVSSWFWGKGEFVTVRAKNLSEAQRLATRYAWILNDEDEAQNKIDGYCDGGDWHTEAIRLVPVHLVDAYNRNGWTRELHKASQTVWQSVGPRHEGGGGGLEEMLLAKGREFRKQYERDAAPMRRLTAADLATRTR